MDSTSTAQSEIMTATDLSLTPDEGHATRPRPVTVENCPEEDDQPTELPAQASSPSARSSLTTATATARTNGSGSSSGSGSTVTRGSTVARGSHRKRIPAARRNTLDGRNTNDSPAGWQHRSPRQPSMPNVLQYLDTDSPAVPHYHPQRVGDHPASWRYEQNGEQTSPTAQSTPSSVNGSFRSEMFSEPILEATSDQSWSPEYTVAGGSPSSTTAKASVPFTAASPGQQMYPMYNTSPDQEPGIPPFPMNPFQGPPNPLPGLGSVQFNQPPPSPGRPPLSGYQLVAAKLSGELGGPPVKPIYRRFETLNHRLLLYLQDEIAELEEQLGHMDAAETYSRCLPGGSLPASRRQEGAQGGEQQMCREILGAIGFKMTQYSEYTPIQSCRYSTNKLRPCPCLAA